MLNEKEIHAVMEDVIEFFKLKYKDKLCTVYLYGSYARGEQTDNSDIDIYIKAKEVETRGYISKMDRQELLEIELKHDVPTHLHVVQDSETTTELFRNVLEEGKVYYDN